MDHLTLTRRIEIVFVSKNKKKNGNLEDISVPADKNERMNERRKINKNLHLAKELKKKTYETWGWQWC